MSLVASFVGVVPPARFDGKPWTEVKIRQSEGPGLPWQVIDTQALAPLDADPAQPAPRSITTTQATLEEAIWGFVWLDAEGHEATTEAPVYNPEEGFPEVHRVWVTPTVEEVAVLEATRTIGSSPGEQGTFTSDTRPTRAQVEAIIRQAVDDVLAQLLPRLKPEHYAEARRAAALWAAILIEGSFFREQSNEGAVQVYQQRYQQAIKGIQESLEEDRKQDLLLGHMEPRTADMVPPWTPVPYPYLVP
jgi:hypothetical protein